MFAKEGQKPIDQLRPGDLVLSRNEQTGEQRYQPVTQTFADPKDEIYDLTLMRSDGTQEILSVTANHPFWKKDRGWTETDLLKIGDLVQGKDGTWITIRGLTIRVERATGYNLEVAEDHTYFVGRSGAWVHNACPIEITEDTIRKAMQTAELKTRQEGVSLPVIQRYVGRLVDGEKPPFIKVNAGVIVDGNHRYIAGRIFGQEPPQVNWAERGNPSPIIPWDEVKIFLNDWGNQ